MYVVDDGGCVETTPLFSVFLFFSFLLCFILVSVRAGAGACVPATGPGVCGPVCMIDQLIDGVDSHYHSKSAAVRPSA